MDENPPSNMVYIRIKDPLIHDPNVVVAKLKERNILVGRESENQFRLVVHLWITDQDIGEVVEGFQQALS